MKDPLHRLRVIVTGTGRCGTKFVSELLTSAGLTCGHERFFDWHGLEWAKRRAWRDWSPQKAWPEFVQLLYLEAVQ